jgi:hypothetical protein
MCHAQLGKQKFHTYWLEIPMRIHLEGCAQLTYAFWNSVNRYVVYACRGGKDPTQIYHVKHANFLQ